MTHLSVINTMSPSAVAKVAAFEDVLLTLPQVDIATQHTLHAGMYARTVMVPAGTVMTGALIKVATLVIINGDVVVYTDMGSVHIEGYAVLSAAAGRKQAFRTNTDTHITMIFPTQATSVAEAETQFTDETDRLMSRKDGAVNTVNQEDAHVW